MLTRRRTLLLTQAGVLALLLPGAALAQSRGVTVANRSGEPVRRILISPAGSASPGENRLRSQLPPHAEARIGYSTGCKIDVRVGYESGRTEEFLNQDACSDLRITAGQGAAAAAPASRPVADARSRGKAEAAKPPQPIAVVVPPWTGRSITKRFGGLD